MEWRTLAGVRGVPKKKQPRDTSTSPLFEHLPEPPATEDLVQLRAVRHPVWTEQKAKLISRYLKLFTLVTKHGTYIDGFAGRQSDKANEGWAAELVLAQRPWRIRHFYFCDAAAEWWGRPDWRPLLDMQHHEKALAFRERLLKLGYKYVSPFPIVDSENGERIMFYMILATDHSEAPKLMWRAYDQAVPDMPGWDQLELLPKS